MSTGALFAVVYIVPAAFVGLGLWMTMLLLREFGLGYKGRRGTFVVLSTMLLAPAIVPAGIIMTAVVPNGLLVLSGSLPMSHQPQLIRFAVGSFVASAVVSGVAARYLFREKMPEQPRRQTPPTAVRCLVPCLVIAALLGFHYRLVPDRTIAAHIGRHLIEREYGTQLDAAVATFEIDELEAVRAERARLLKMFENDPLVVSVRMGDRRLRGDLEDSSMLYSRRTNSRGYSCSSAGDGKYENDGLMRCTHHRGLFNDLETIQYRRTFTSGGVKSMIIVQFDYDAFLKRHHVTGSM